MQIKFTAPICKHPPVYIWFSVKRIKPLFYRCFAYKNQRSDVMLVSSSGMCMSFERIYIERAREFSVTHIHTCKHELSLFNKRVYATLMYI